MLFIIERYKLKDCIEREKVCHNHTKNDDEIFASIDNKNLVFSFLFVFWEKLNTFTFCYKYALVSKTKERESSTQCLISLGQKSNLSSRD